ncbi:MAG: hypothetical protein AAFX62_07475 [Pseudomonadota bacterium]
MSGPTPAMKATERALRPITSLMRIVQQVMLVVASLVAAQVPLLLVFLEHCPEVEGQPRLPPVVTITTILGSAAVFWGLVLLARRWRRNRADKTTAAASKTADMVDDGFPEDAREFREWVGRRLRAEGWKVEAIAPTPGGPAYVVEGPMGGSTTALPLWVRAEERSISAADMREWAALTEKMGVPVTAVATLDGIDAGDYELAERLGVVTVEPDELPHLAKMIVEGFELRRRSA